MESILAAVFREHHHHEAWWHMLKVTPKVASHSTKDARIAPNEAPGERCVSKLLGITMIDDFVGFQTTFLDMNHQEIDAAEWSAFDQK